jgi:hypothetical protein
MGKAEAMSRALQIITQQSVADPLALSKSRRDCEIALKRRAGRP